MKRSIRIADADWEVMEAVWDEAPVAASIVAEKLKSRRGWFMRPRISGLEAPCHMMHRRTSIPKLAVVPGGNFLLGKCLE